MADYYSMRRLATTTLAILLKTISCATVAFGQYTWVQDTDTAANWDDVAQWTCGGVRHHS